METPKNSPSNTCEITTSSYVGVLTIEAHAQVRAQAPSDGWISNELKPNKDEVAIATLAPGEKVAVKQLIQMRSLNPFSGFKDTVAQVTLNDGREGYVPVNFAGTRYGALEEGSEAVQALCREKLMALKESIQGNVAQVSNNSDVQANGGLNLRAATSTDAAILAKIPAGAKVMVIPGSELHQDLPDNIYGGDPRSMDWVQVNWKNAQGDILRGWVSKEHLEPIKK